jgi:hemolysin III
MVMIAETATKRHTVPILERVARSIALPVRGLYPGTLRESHDKAPMKARRRGNRKERGLSFAVRPEDEFANFLTHGLGFVLSVLGAIVLMKVVLTHGDFWTIVGCGSYCASLVALYAASTLSHAFYDVYRRHFYRKIDQICIFFLIAGSYTPFGVVYLNHGYWPILTVTMWTLALLGAASILSHGFLTAGAQKIYLLLGWLPSFSLMSIIQQAPTELIFWLVLGGLSYTLGTIFLYQDHRVRYFHAMWHTLVIAGSICQYIAILILVTT